MADQGGSKSESESELVFQNQESPLEDTAVCIMESKVRQRKKALTISVNKISDSVRIILKASEGGSENGNNLVVTIKFCQTCAYDIMLICRSIL